MTALSRGSLFADIPRKLPTEISTVLAAGDDARIERIVSRGHTTPPGEWHEQDEDEWVLLVTGAARLDLVNGESISLGPGDWINLPAGLQHRVSWTTPDIETIWLTVFYPPRAASAID